jgi:hypothetical protein
VWCGGPGPPTRLPFRILLRPENLRHRGDTERYSAAIARQKTLERERLSGREKSAGEIPSRRGEIVDIATVVELGFIGIIIITISTAEHHHPHHSALFCCNIWTR